MWPLLFFVSVIIGCLVYRWRLDHESELHEKINGLEKENARILRKFTDEARQSEARQKAILNSMIEGLIVLDEEGRIEDVNESFRNLFSIEHDVKGQSILEAVRLHELHHIVQRLPAEKIVLGAELNIPGLDQKQFQVNGASILDPPGKQKGAVLVLHDLTRLKQLENTRQEFVANVSHELRTPLSLIKGYVETLIDGAKDDPCVIDKFLHIIEKHADRLTYLIEDLLTIARLQSGQITLNVQSTDLWQITERVIEDLEAKAVAKRITLLNGIPPGLLAPADSNRLQQVLFNLVDNAIKYSNSGATVTIDSSMQEENCQIAVRDNGPGIPAESVERVFERFYRVDKARSREQGGTGLGLAIVKHIVKSHGGEAWVESEYGKGSNFCFTLPVKNLKTLLVTPP
ncbi:MAG: sensor histidine kinase [Verrucomicrobiales bacterium]|nr:sensor histidine kinase [Verrucomicrobiales bacterium]